MEESTRNTTTTSLPSQNKTLHIALWVLQIGAAAMFVMSAIPKFTGADAMVQLFETIGIGQWLRYVTAALELAGGVMLLIPALAGLGGLVLAIVMAGAVLAHLLVLGGSPLLPLALLAVTAFIAWKRGPEW